MPGRPHPALACTSAVLALLVCLLTPAPAPAVAGNAVWSPAGSAAYALDRAHLLAELAAGHVEVPDPQGRLVAFRVAPTSVMEPALAEAHPELRSWAGTAVGNPSSIRVTSTPEGVHVSVRGVGPAWYVDPAGGRSLYRTYAGAALPAPPGLVEPPLPARTHTQQAARAAADPVDDAAPGALATLHTYRLALLSDPSFAAYTAPGADAATSNAAVLAAKVVLVDRIDQIYGDDLGIRLVLVDGTDTRLNLRTIAEATGANGPCGLSACYPPDLLAAGCTQPILDRNRWVIGQLIGARNYDVGHLTLGIDSGGLAYLDSAGHGTKAGGCTGLSAPSSDAYAVDYLAHELGHQFGADHTFDGTGGECAHSRVAGSAVEPGSGSTIMGYAGICGADDLQSHSDPAFSTVSREQVDSFLGEASFAVPEWQSVALTGFDGTDAFRLQVGDATTSTITRGSTYDAADIRAALTAVLPGGSSVQVRPFFDENAFDDRGFALYYVTYAGSFAADVPEPVVVPVSGQFTSAVNDIDAGNPAATSAGTVSTPGNHNPAVAAPADRTIPVGTPFALTGSGSDPDGDALGYVWEETDTSGAGAGTALATQPRTGGPLFRVFGTASSAFANAPNGAGATRSFPDLAQVVAGDTDAATGSCPGGAGQVDCLSEWLPTAAYAPDALHFRLTASDAQAPAGGTASDDVVLTLDKSVGPFRVTSQATTPATAYAGGSSQIVSWTPGTSGLAPQVRITLSADGGVTFPYVLDAGTDNDGSATVALPDLSTGAARIRVEAVDNYFYDVNDAPFAIQGSGGPPPIVVDRSAVPATWSTQFSDPAAAVFSASGGSGRLAASSTALPAGLSLSGTGPWTIGGRPSAPPGTYPVTVTVTDGTRSTPFTVNVVVTPEDATVVYSGPTSVVGADPAATSVPVTLKAQVSQAADGNLGALDRATVRFADGSTVLCAAAPVSTSGVATCSFAADLSHARSVTYRVGLFVGGSYAGTSSTPASVTVSLPPTPHPGPPDTSITSGPSGWLLASSASFGVSSTAGAPTYVCRLDAVRVDCAGSSVTVTGLTPGAHQLSVASVDADGERDATPATREFAVPVDDTALAAVGRWQRRGSDATYLGTFSQTRRKGAALTYRVTHVEELALLVRTGKRYGAVKVYLDKELLATVRTRGPAGSRMVRVAQFPAPRSGTVRIVTTSRSTVAVDGLGVSAYSF